MNLMDKKNMDLPIQILRIHCFRLYINIQSMYIVSRLTFVNSLLLRKRTILLNTSYFEGK